MDFQARSEVYKGLGGDVVRLFEPFTEADPVAILAQFLVGFGSAVGHGPHLLVGETRHYLNEYLLVVGATSRARKGDSVNVALRPLRDADPEWARNIGPGLSSGEGLVYHVRDRVERRAEDGSREVVDEGVTDKRLLVVESEFSSPLRQFARQGNILSPILRAAWDCLPTLRSLVKNRPDRATDAHISILGHCTPEDLHHHLSSIDVANGFANRFLVLLARRSKKLPNPAQAPPEAVADLAHRVQAALCEARKLSQIRRTPEADALWAENYDSLTLDRPGLAGQMLARAEAHVLRLSALYSLTAQCSAIDCSHIESALAFWDYSAGCVQGLFAGRTGDDVADRIFENLEPERKVSLSHIRDELFHRHVTSADPRRAVDLLHRTNLVTVKDGESTGGRKPVEITRMNGQPVGGWHELSGESWAAR